MNNSVKSAPKKKSGGLGSLSSMAKNSKGKPKKAKVQTKPTSSIASIFDTIGQKKPAAETLSSSKDEPAKPSLMSSIFDTVKSKPVNESKGPEKSEETTDDDKIEITKVFDFAGDLVK